MHTFWVVPLNPVTLQFQTDTRKTEHQNWFANPHTLLVLDFACAEPHTTQSKRPEFVGLHYKSAVDASPFCKYHCPTSQIANMMKSRLCQPAALWIFCSLAKTGTEARRLDRKHRGFIYCIFCFMLTTALARQVMVKIKPGLQHHPWTSQQSMIWTSVSPVLA